MTREIHYTKTIFGIIRYQEKKRFNGLNDKIEEISQRHSVHYVSFRLFSVLLVDGGAWQQ